MKKSSYLQADDIETINHETENIFLGHKLFSDSDAKDIKNLVDIITMETDVNDILFDHEPVDVTPNVPSATDPTADFSHVLLSKNKGKIRQQKKKKYQKMEQNKNNKKVWEAKKCDVIFVKQVPLYPRGRLNKKNNIKTSKR